LGQGQIKDLIEGTWGVPVLVGDITQQAAPAALTVTGATIAVSWLGGLVNLFGIISRGLMSIYTQIGRHKWMLPYDLLLALSHRLGAWTGFWRKGKKTWGVVFESMTGEPVSGAYVLFYSKSGNLTTDFTDRRGRYFLEPAPDSYEVKVEADNYLFPAKKDLTGVVQFSNIYVKGQIILVNEKRKFMRVAIPLDKLVAGWREKTSYYLAKIRYWVSLIAILASFYTILVRPDNRMNWIVVILACWYWGLYILGKTISAMKEE
jgi:hypothetical protein